MSLAELRDLFIVIFAILGIGATIFLSIIAFIIFRKIRDMLNSGRATLESLHAIATVVSEDIAKPLGSIASVFQGVAKAVEIITGPFRRKEGRKGGRG